MIKWTGVSHCVRLPKSRFLEFLMILHELALTYNKPKTIHRVVILSVTIIASTRDNNFLATWHDNGKYVKVQKRCNTSYLRTRCVYVFFKWDVPPICKTYKYLRIPQEYTALFWQTAACTESTHFFLQIKRPTTSSRLRRTSKRFTCLQIIICPRRSSPSRVFFNIYSPALFPKSANCNQIT